MGFGVVVGTAGIAPEPRKLGSRSRVATAWFTYTTDHQQAKPPTPGLQATRFARLTALVATRCDDPGQVVCDRDF
jgi:hypothetical protein